MTLDMAKVVSQVRDLITSLNDSAAQWQARRHAAFQVFQDSARAVESLQPKVKANKDSEKFPWRIAEILEGLANSYTPSPPPRDFTVIATDGSHIEADRHSPIKCCLLNISQVMLRYGYQSDAILKNESIILRPEELYINDPSSPRRLHLEGNLLGMKRTVAELEALADMAEQMSHPQATLALMDGSLFWRPEGRPFPEFVRTQFVENGILAALERLSKMLSRPLSVAGYISHSRGDEVTGNLRLFLCPKDNPDCRNMCRSRTPDDLTCGPLEGLLDRDIFIQLLCPDERSAVFASRAYAPQKNRREHKTYFFYLRIEDEIARVEVPEWVAQDPELVDLTHSLVVDQCRRGQGYPVAISEAHEQAVVTTRDREQFWQLVHLNLAESSLSEDTSGKSRSKRTRWV